MQTPIAWIDMPVSNLERAMSFYQKITNIEVTKMAGNVEAAIMAHQQGEASICLFVSEDEAPSASGPIIYISVNQALIEAVKMVEECGGRLIKGIHQIGPYGNRAIILDSEGNRVALHQGL